MVLHPRIGCLHRSILTPPRSSRRTPYAVHPNQLRPIKSIVLTLRLFIQNAVRRVKPPSKNQPLCLSGSEPAPYGGRYMRSQPDLPDGLSEADIRNNESERFGSTNMIFHQGTTNIFYQPVKPLRILGVAEKFRKITLGCH